MQSKYMNVDKLMFIMAFFILVVAVSSCDKENESANELPFYKISESLHPFLFSEDSRWIYSNPVSNDTDTLVLVDFEIDSFSLDPTGPGQGSSGNTQFFNLSYESSFFQDYDEQLVGYLISRGLISGGYTYLSSYEIGEENKNVLLLDIIDTLIIGDLIFNNVVMMDVTADEHFSDDMNLYYVDSIGIVRKEIKLNNSIIETWDLVEYDVNLHQVE